MDDGEFYDSSASETYLVNSLYRGFYNFRKIEIGISLIQRQGDPDDVLRWGIVDFRIGGRFGRQYRCVRAGLFEIDDLLYPGIDRWLYRRLELDYLGDGRMAALSILGVGPP